MSWNFENNASSSHPHSEVIEDKNEKYKLPMPPLKRDEIIAPERELTVATGSVSQEEPIKRNSSIQEKLYQIYLEKYVPNDGPFIKCNYLEELVEQDNLNYLILQIYPAKKCFLFIKNPEKVQFICCLNHENSDFFNSIDNEEIPTCIFDLIDSYCWDLIYDYHCFLKIQKFTVMKIDAEPIFSSFVLLKPTSSVLITLANKYGNERDQNMEDEISCEAVKKFESKLLLSMSGPLYLSSDQTVLKRINTLRIYNSPLASVSYKFSLLQKETSLQKEILMFKSSVDRLCSTFQNLVTLRGSSLNGFCTLKNVPSFSKVHFKEDLHSSLAKREINTVFIESYQTTPLLEVFYFKPTKKKSCKVRGRENDDELEEKTYKLLVYLENGLFYSFLTYDGYERSPIDYKSLVSPNGQREDLDKYIVAVAEVLSNKFSRTLYMHHVNEIEKEKVCFFSEKENYEDDNGRKSGIVSDERREEEMEEMMGVNDAESGRINANEENCKSFCKNICSVINRCDDQISSRETCDFQISDESSVLGPHYCEDSDESSLSGVTYFEDEQAIWVFEGLSSDREKCIDLQSSRIKGKKVEVYRSIESEFIIDEEEEKQTLQDIIDNWENCKKLFMSLESVSDDDN